MQRVSPILKAARVALAALVAAAVPSALASDGLGLTPPMGWDSWNELARNVGEKLVRGIRFTFEEIRPRPQPERQGA